VSSKGAKAFFSGAKSKIEAAYKTQPGASSDEETVALIDPGMTQRQLKQGEEIELHFSSQNAQEENGAVLCTYQSSIPSYKGEKLSHPLALRSSSAIRLLCHILREPLFDSLRTKQQLGYIVSSYYEIGVSSQSNEDGRVPLTTPVDFISVNVLSQKMAPPDIVDRIDEFMGVFRKSLEEMPGSEIRDHAESLRTKLLKPPQKLSSEASLQFSRIQRYGPEVFHRSMHHEETPATTSQGEDSGDGYEIPWNTTNALASAICTLSREDLLETFDRMTNPSSRSRIISCVYGKKFPLDSSKAGATVASSMASSKSFYSSPFFSLMQLGQNTSRKTKVVDRFQDLFGLRKTLSRFDAAGPSSATTGRPNNQRAGTVLSKLLQNHRSVFTVGLGFFGATILGLTLVSNDRIGGKMSSPKLKESS